MIKALEHGSSLSHKYLYIWYKSIIESTPHAKSTTHESSLSQQKMWRRLIQIYSLLILGNLILLNISMFRVIFFSLSAPIYMALNLNCLIPSRCIVLPLLLVLTNLFCCLQTGSLRGLNMPAKYIWFRHRMDIAHHALLPLNLLLQSDACSSARLLT